MKAIANAVDSSTPIATRPAVRRRLGGADPAGHRDQAGERGCRRVDEQQLREREVDPVGAADCAEREREEQLGGDVAAEELEPLASVARHRPEARERCSSRRHDLGAQPGTVSTIATATTSATTIAATRRPSVRALELARVDRDVRRTGARAGRAHLDDRLGDAVDGAGGDRLLGRSAHPLEEADVDRDPARRARDGQVDELDRRLEDDARQERRAASATAPRNEIPGTKVSWARMSADATQARFAPGAARRRSCRSRSRRAV